MHFLSAHILHLAHSDLPLRALAPSSRTQSLSIAFANSTRLAPVHFAVVCFKHICLLHYSQLSHANSRCSCTFHISGTTPHCSHLMSFQDLRYSPLCASEQSPGEPPKAAGMVWCSVDNLRWLWCAALTWACTQRLQLRLKRPRTRTRLGVPQTRRRAYASRLVLCVCQPPPPVHLLQPGSIQDRHQCLAPRVRWAPSPLSHTAPSTPRRLWACHLLWVRPTWMRCPPLPYPPPRPDAQANTETEIKRAFN